MRASADVAFAMLFLEISYILLKEWYRGLWMSFNHNKVGADYTRYCFSTSLRLSNEGPVSMPKKGLSYRSPMTRQIQTKEDVHRFNDFVSTHQDVKVQIRLRHAWKGTCLIRGISFTLSCTSKKYIQN